MNDDPFIKHAALILRQELGVTVEKARFMAWCEGPTGYTTRLLKEEEAKDQGEAQCS